MSNETFIGPVDAFGSLPAFVEVDGTPYWLVRREDGGYRLLMALCPHAGGEVLRTDGMFYCPLHFWTFDETDGVCLNVRDERLARRDAEERDGSLYAVGPVY
ncbi:Rieske (2Fe-2S) protein [Cohnella thermotolerans]|uniref:Rieske (2Fe-2S) protein n=1 Tax=Cohnella thermotolerans TaxID=329858 RepID=UPI00041844DE|nr:Rieske (2Fe-2S) protein [Cohnella thermotolerans]